MLFDVRIWYLMYLVYIIAVNKVFSPNNEQKTLITLLRVGC